MKKTILSAVAMLVCISSFAQSQHLTVNGVPMDGTTKDFAESLVKSGFQLAAHDNGVYMLAGSYDGYNNCRIGIITVPDIDLAFSSVVIFPEHKDWNSLCSNYFEVKKSLTALYGEPAMCVEKFDEKVADEDKLHELQFDRCKYASLFSTKKGDLELSMEHDESYTCYVVLRMTDSINYDKVRQVLMKNL